MGLLPIHLVAVDSQVYYIAMEGTAPYYVPFFATIPVGDAVQWLNQTATARTVTHDACLTEMPCAFDSGSVTPGNSFALPFLAAGPIIIIVVSTPSCVALSP